MRTLELRRHAKRDPAADRLSVAGQAQAEDVGRGLAVAFDVVFVSPAQRAADNDGSPLAMAGVVSALLDAVPEGGRGLAVSHTPLIERAVLGLSARELEPLGECEGIVLSKRDDDDELEITEIRLRSR